MLRTAGSIAVCTFALTLTACSGTTTGGTASSGSPASSAVTSSSPSSTTTDTGDAPSAAELLAKSKAATAAAKSGRASGSFVDGGKKYTITTSGTTDSSNGHGSFTMDTASLEYVIASGSAYVRGNQAFWTESGAPADTAKQLAASKKWVKAPAAQFKQFTEQASFSGLAKALFADSGSANSLTEKVTSQTVNGVACWEVTDRFSGEDARLDIAKDTYLPVQVSSTQSGTTQKLAFDKWNAAPTATAPAASEVTSTT